MRDFLAAFRPIRYAIVGALVVCLGLAFGSARAADATLTWTHPTQYTDDTPIPAGALTQTSLIYGKCNAGQTGLLATPAPVTLTVPFPATSKVVTGLADGTWCFAARSETASAQSAWTGYVFKVIVLTPKPPVLSSTITLAYETWSFGGRTYLGRSIGTLPLGTPCEAALVQSFGLTYFQVPKTAVTITPGRTPNPGPFVTKCA